MDITPESLQVLFTSFSNSFQSSLTNYDPFLDKIATVVPSSTETLTIGFMNKLARAREWIGPRILHNAEALAQVVRNQKFENTVEVPRTRIEDDTYGIYSPMFASLGTSMAQLPEVELTTKIEANSVGFDGLGLYSNAHPLDPAGNQSNLLSAALDFTGLSSARAAMRSFKGADGLPLGVKPSMLMVPPALEGEALKLVNGAFYPVAGAAAMSNIWQGSVSVLVNPLLTSDSAWYLLAAGESQKPFGWSQRMSPELVPLINPSDPNVFFQDSYVYGARMRGSAFVGPWYLSLKSDPTP